MPQRLAQPILLSILDPAQRRVAIEACIQLQFDTVSLHHLLPIAVAREVGLALICDGIHLNRGEDGILAVRRQRPLLPIHVFTPMLPGVTALVAGIARIPGVTVSEYWRQPRDRNERVIALEQVLTPSPYLAVHQGLMALPPIGSSQRCRALVSSILQIHSRGQRPTIRAIALQLGTSIRSLWRHWPRELGQPKSFCRELTLLLALYARRHSHGDWSRIAADLGTSEATLRRARKRSNELGAEDPARPFHAIGAMCRATQEHVLLGLSLLNL